MSKTSDENRSLNHTMSPWSQPTFPSLGFRFLAFSAPGLSGAVLFDALLPVLLAALLALPGGFAALEGFFSPEGGSSSSDLLSDFGESAGASAPLSSGLSSS